MTERKLVRSRDQRLIAGICGGFAEWVGWDPTLVRVAYVVISILSAGFPGTIAYIALWFIMPEGPRNRPRRFSVDREP